MTTLSSAAGAVRDARHAAGLLAQLGVGASHRDRVAWLILRPCRMKLEFSALQFDESGGTFDDAELRAE